jgi:enterochelin esterase-like enzyme
VATRSIRRTVIVLAAAVWLGAGLAAAYGYAHRYMVYRGFPPPKTPPGTPIGATRRVSFYSRALGTRTTYLVHLPAGYARAAAAGRRFPVLYVLHGHPGLARNILEAGAIGSDLDTLVHRHEARPMILVLPEITNGPEAGGDTEWADTPYGNYEHVLVDLVHAVDRRFATVRSRQGRIIAGLSSGAYGAVNVGLRHLALFGGIQSWSGYFVQDPNGVFTGATPAELTANSPEEYVKSLAPQIRRLGLHVYVYVGRADGVPLLSELPTFIAGLQDDGAQVQAAEFAGRHDWALWRREMPRMLRVASDWFRHPARPVLGRRSAAARRAQARQRRAFRRAARLREQAVVRALARQGLPDPQLLARHPDVLKQLRRELRRQR